ncbi:MAG TPA: ABC transporter permease [Gaiellaceae bacterium]|nr:ABC transporter permease [Gaiellaceae bacterium]
MLGYLSKRIAWGAVLFLAITLVVYVLFFIIPVDPTRRGRGTTAEELYIREAYSIEGPIWEEYPRFVWGVVRHGDLGNSYGNRQEVSEIIRRAAPVTISLVVGAAFFWLLIAIPVGTISALRPRSVLDRASMLFVLVGISLHPLWMGLVFSYFAGYRWGIAPIGGYCNLLDNDVSQRCAGLIPWAHHLLLPWFTLSLLFAALYTRMVRASVLDTMQDDYVRTAIAKGASSWRVVRSHVLRNALLPIVTMLAMDLGVALGMSFFVEIAFGLPGLGSESVRALRRRDLPVIVGVTTVGAIAVVTLTTIVDIVYGLLDPRVRRAHRYRGDEQREPELAAAETASAPAFARASR